MRAIGLPALSIASNRQFLGLLDGIQNFFFEVFVDSHLVLVFLPEDVHFSSELGVGGLDIVQLDLQLVQLVLVTLVQIDVVSDHSGGRSNFLQMLAFFIVLLLGLFELVLHNHEQSKFNG